MRLLPILVAALALLVPSTAAASANKLIADCVDDGHIDGHYSQQDYSKALAHLPSDVDEYSNCRDQIREAQLAAAGGGGGGSQGGGGGGGSATGGGSGGGTGGGGAFGTTVQPDALASATPEERAAISRAQQADPHAPLEVAPHVTLPPAATGFTAGATGGSLPTPAIAAIAAVGALLLAGTGLGIRNLVHARRAQS